MKKLFALVLSIAMVLAIAAPAMAAGWEAFPENSAGLKDITVDVIALETAANTTLLGKIWSPLTTSIPVVQGYPVHQVVVVTVPAAKYLTGLTQGLIKNLNLDLAVDFTNIALTDFDVYIDDGTGLVNQNVTVSAGDLAGFTKNGFEPSFGDAAYGKTYYFEFWGNVAASGKDAKVDATLGFYNEFDADGLFQFDWVYSKAYGFYNNYDVTHTVSTNGDLFAIDNGDGVVTFTVNPKTEKVNAKYPMTIAMEDAVYEITKNYVNALAFRTVDGTILSSGNTYNDLKDIYDDIFGVLGFGYEDANYMSEAHFEKYFGTVSEIEDGYNYSTGTVVVVTPDVEPPQTGDNASVIGFVMVAVALVAAAAVTLKKVRA